MTLPKIGERWRWSYCSGPSWCCGNEGTVVRVDPDGTRVVKLDRRSPVPRNTYDGQVGFDGFDPTDLEIRRMERV